MSICVSSGFLEHDNTIVGVLDLLNSNDLHIKFYNGMAPEVADDAVSGTCLCTIKRRNNEFLRFDIKGNSIVLRPVVIPLDVSRMSFFKRLKTAFVLICKKITPVYYIHEITGIAEATGIATYFRLCSRDDSGEKSFSDIRIQGPVTFNGAGINVNSTSITNGSIQTIMCFNLNYNAWEGTCL